MSLDLAFLAGAALLMALAVGAAGVCYGLWRGEKGRREAAEAMLVLGAPQAKPAKRVTMQNAPALEPRMAPQGWDDETLKKGVEAIKAEAKAAGVTLSEDQALVMAGDMLHRAVYGGGEPDDVTVG